MHQNHSHRDRPHRHTVSGDGHHYYHRNSSHESSHSNAPPIQRHSSYESTHSNDKKKNLVHYIDTLGLPHAFLPTISKLYNSCAARLFLVENSSYMKTHDSHLIRLSPGDSDRINVEKQNGVSRWRELAECVGFHAKMSARCGIPTKFWFVNDPSDSEDCDENRCFSIGWHGLEDHKLEHDLKRGKQVMTHIKLDQQANPLSEQLHRMAKGIAHQAEVERLDSKGKFISVVICTQGMPTDDETGRRGSTSAVREFKHELHSLSKLPVKLVFRLCTDEEKVRDFFNSLDAKLDACDVLDDFWGEAMEVYLVNPWLTYGIGLHRLREAGLATDLMDDLDEKRFTLDDIHRFCFELFVGKRGGSKELPHPRKSWSDFMFALEALLRNELPQYNAVKKKFTPWIDMRKLDAMYGPKRSGPPRRSSTMDPPRESSHSHGGQYYDRRSSQGDSASRASRHQPPKSSPRNENLNLDQILERWAHQPPDYQTLYPLQTLLVTVPNTFPPANTKVETHEYFSKWKEVSKEAFGETDCDDELKDLLKRAVRKAKFFLHPDKLPNDLNDDQSKLFRYIWDKIQEQEEKYLN